MCWINEEGWLLGFTKNCFVECALWLCFFFQVWYNSVTITAHVEYFFVHYTSRFRIKPPLKTILSSRLWGVSVCKSFSEYYGWILSGNFFEWLNFQRSECSFVILYRMAIVLVNIYMGKVLRDIGFEAKMCKLCPRTADTRKKLNSHWAGRNLYWAAARRDRRIAGWE